MVQVLMARVVTCTCLSIKVRNQNDKSYGSGVEVERGIYEINGFQIRFFTEKEIEELATAEGSMIDMYIQFGIQKLKWCIQEIA